MNTTLHPLLLNAEDSGNMHITRCEKATFLFNAFHKKCGRKMSEDVIILLCVKQCFTDDKMMIPLETLNSMLKLDLSHTTLTKINKVSIYLNENFPLLFSPAINKKICVLKYLTPYLNIKKKMYSHIINTSNLIINPKQIKNVKSLRKLTLIKSFITKGRAFCEITGKNNFLFVGFVLKIENNVFPEEKKENLNRLPLLLGLSQRKFDYWKKIIFKKCFT